MTKFETIIAAILIYWSGIALCFFFLARFKRNKFYKEYKDKTFKRGNFKDE